MQENLIHNKLKPLEGYLISIEIDTINGWYELKIGIPKNWVYKENSNFKIEEVLKSEDGIILKVTPKNNDVVIDDLIDFVLLIIDTNFKIVEKEKEFESKINEIKKQLEDQAKSFYKDIDEMKEKSFSVFEKVELEINEKKTVPKGKKKQITNKEENEATKTEQENIVD
jgi:hypothetical protein